MQQYQSDIIIAGAGISGLITAYELLKNNKKVIIFDKDIEANLGGLAREAAGGVHVIGTPEQRRIGIKDSPELALKDWLGLAQFDAKDYWPRQWAEFYCYNSIPYIHDYYREVGLKFFSVMWAERGLFTPGNSVPRWHFTWGTGFELVNKTLEAIANLPQRANLQIFFEHEVNDVQQGNHLATLHGKNMKTGEEFIATGNQVIIASGGIGGGDLSELKKHWPINKHKTPKYMLNGAHKFGDGLLHHKIEEHGGVLTNLENNWLYAVGVHHPEKRKPFDGISLQPGPGALWFNAVGHRIGPFPLFGLANTKFLVDHILNEPGQYTWLIMNMRIAKKELIVSLSRYLNAIRAKNVPLLIKNTLFGDAERIRLLVKEAPDDVFMAASLDELIDQMQERSLNGFKLDRAKIKAAIKDYDDQIARGPAYHNDEQLRRIANFRQYLPDRLRLCKFQKVIDKKGGPLLAVRSFLITRKSLGGIQTDLDCRVLKKDGTPFGNIYAVGEAAGYGGGGIHGKGAPEGAFLGGCILTARKCAEGINSS
jgi:predicted oxidoreductase